MNKVVRNTFIYTLGGLLSPVLGFVLLPLYTRYLNPAEYGIIAAIYALILLFKVFYSFSLERSLVRLYWDYKSDYEQRVFLSTMTVGIAGLVIIMSAISILFFHPIQRIFPQIPAHPFYLIGLIMVNEQIVFNIIQNVFRIKEKANSFVILTTSHFLVKTVLIIVFVVVIEKGLLGYFYAELISALLFIFIFIFIIRDYFVFSFDFSMFKSAFRFALPYLPGFTGSWIVGQSDKIFIAGMLSLSDVGIYAISVKVASVLGIVDASFKNAYLPHYFKTTTTKSTDLAKIKLEKSNDIYIQFLMFIGFSVIFLSKEIIVTLVDSRFEQAYQYLPILIISAVLGSLSSTILGTALQQSKKTVADSSFGLIAAGITLTLNFILIRAMGLMGANYSRLASVIVLAIISYFYVKKYAYYIPFRWKTIAVSLLAYGMLYLVFEYLIHYDIVFMAIIKVIVIGSLGILLFFNYDGKSIFKNRT